MPAIEDYKFGTGPLGSAEDFAAVTPSDGTDLTFRCRALYIGVTGNVSVLALDGSTAVVFQAVPAGSVLMIRTARVRATGTTATGIIALR